MGGAIDINALASSAKIFLTEAEAGEISLELEKMLETADSLLVAGVEGAIHATCATGGISSSNAPGEACMDGANNGAGMVLTVSGLRADEPIHDIETEVFYEQSPSPGGGFTIPRLLE